MNGRKICIKNGMTKKRDAEVINITRKLLQKLLTQKNPQDSHDSTLHESVITICY